MCVQIYTCKLHGRYLSTLVPYYHNMFLLDKIVIGCTDTTVTYIFPDYKSFSVTTLTKSELHEDDTDITYTKGSPQSNYLNETLDKHIIYSQGHLQCVVNLYYDYCDNVITLHKLKEV